MSWVLGGSFITCCLALSWVEYQPSVEGMDVNLVFDPDLLPERLVVSPDDSGCGARLQEHIVPGATYVFDQACADYNLLETIHVVGAFFVSPLARDAVFRVIEVVLPRQSRRQREFADWLIELNGLPPQRECRLACRLTTHWTGEGAAHLITNRFDLRSSVVFGIYRHRWEIALFLNQVRLSPAQRSLLGSGRGLSPPRLFGSLLILRTWQRIIGRAHREWQDIVGAMEELHHSVLGLRPRGEMVRYRLGSQNAHPSTSQERQAEALKVPALRSRQITIEGAELARG